MRLQNFSSQPKKRSNIFRRYDHSSAIVQVTGHTATRINLLGREDDDGEDVSKEAESSDEAEEDAFAPELEAGPGV